MIVEVADDIVEQEENACATWLRDMKRLEREEADAALVEQKDKMARAIDGYAAVHAGWFIRYDPDQAAMDYHYECAKSYAAGIAEADALPPGTKFASRPFSELNDISVRALGKVLHHVACATRLKATTSGLELRNLLTVFARKDDVAAVWRQSGETEAWTRRILSALTLDAAHARAIERDFEIPLPYYIDFGRDFVLLPMFGGLLNPLAGMVAHLRRAYRSDWDRGVDGREASFRQDLEKLFPSPRYRVLDHGVVLKRQDGSKLTDVDAVILDSETGALALVQLKAFDIYGRSLAERESRRKNLLHANRWVDRVHEWIAGRSCREIANAIGLSGGGAQSPQIVVTTRHTALFTDEGGYDARAHWISWPRLGVLRAQYPDSDLDTIFAMSLSVARPDHTASRHLATYHLPGLKVEIVECLPR